MSSRPSASPFMPSFGYITRAFPPLRSNTNYSFDVVPSRALKPSVSALVDSRSIPKMDSRLLTASRDPPIGTPIQKVGGSSTLAPLMYRLESL